MRYSIQNVTEQQVINIGGKDIKATRFAIFAELTLQQVEILKQRGCIIKELLGVQTAVLPPTPVAAQPVYSMYELSYAMGIEQIRQQIIPPLYGSGINIAIIGTGIRETHQLVKGRVVYSKNYTNDTINDGYDHDTGVASIIVTVAPQCNILNLKVIDDSGYGSEEEVVLAIDDLITMKEEGHQLSPHVINLSLGSPDIGDQNDIMRLACREAINQGIWVVASAGNSGPNSGTITVPANEQYVACAGSAKFEPFQISTFSSRGPTKEGLTKPDGIFFGEDIVMASSVGDTITVAKSGTSFSAPFGSGIVALLIEGMLRKAKSSAVPITINYEQAYSMTEQDFIDTYAALICVKPEGQVSGKDNSYGYGVPFAPLMLQNFNIQPTQGVTSIFSAIMPMMVMIPMFGMFDKMGKNNE